MLTVHVCQLFYSENAIYHYNGRQNLTDDRGELLLQQD